MLSCDFLIIDSIMSCLIRVFIYKTRRTVNRECCHTTPLPRVHTPEHLQGGVCVSFNATSLNPRVGVDYS